MNSAFDFSKYRVAQQPESQLEKSSQVENGFDFKKYRMKEEPSTLQEATRHISRLGSRAAESILGFPGDVTRLITSIGEKVPEAPQILQREPSFVQRAGKKLIESLPSSDEIKQFSSYLTQGFTDPKSAQEELGDEITSLATILINPSKAVQSFPKFLKSIGSSVVKASAVKGSGKTAEAFGAEEPTKNAIELGTLFLTGLVGQKTANKFVSEKYQQAKSAIPEGTILNTENLATNLANVEKELSKGVSTPTKDEVKKALSELKSKASTGAMEAEEVVEAFHNINERMNSKKLFDELNTAERKLLKRRYDLVKNEISSELEKYGKYNPKFYKTWQEANEGYASIAQSKKVSNYLQSKLGKMPHHLAGSIALDLFLKTPTATAGVLTGYSAVKAGELMARIAKSPTLRRHYIGVIEQAAKENIGGVIKNLEALDKGLQDKHATRHDKQIQE